MKILSLALVPILLAACGATINTGTTAGPSNPAVAASCPSGLNVMPVTVNGAYCGSSQYINEPCAQVTICQPGSTSNCQTISNILVDTGSYGLRIFQTAINSTVLSGLTPLTVSHPSGYSYAAECAEFGSGATWGQVEKADVYLTGVSGGEQVASVPIQVINDSYSGGYTQSFDGSQICPFVHDTSPSTAGYNGILGLGLLDQDCGSNCSAAVPSDPNYFACNGTSSCVGVDSTHGASMSLANQVQNPGFSIGTDSDGLEFILAATNTTGNLANDGCVVFGIGTRSNNTPTTGTAYAANAEAEFTVTISGNSYTQSFIDSGSNALYLDPSLPITACGGSLTGWYCPAGLVNQTFTVNSIASAFSVENASTLFSTSNKAFGNLGGPLTEDGSPVYNVIDLGIPYFMGRSVWVGFTGQSNPSAFSGAVGPYWAY